MSDLSQEDKEVINEVVGGGQAKYELELWLSTDGKHTVRYKADTAEGKRQGLQAALALFDAIVKRYGTKAEMLEGVTNGKKTPTPQPQPQAVAQAGQGEEVKICPLHGEKMYRRMGKFGEYWSHGYQNEQGVWFNCKGKGYKESRAS